MSWPDEPYWSADNAISNEEDDRITAEEAAKTPDQVNEEALAILMAAYERRGERLMAAAYLIGRLNAAYQGKRVTDLDEAWEAYRKAGRWPSAEGG